MTLDRQSIGILVSRILGIYVLTIALGYFPLISGGPAASNSAGNLGYVYILIGFLLHLALSYVLLYHARRIGSFFVSETSSGDLRSSLTIEEITTAAFVIIGVVLLVRAIPAFVGTLLSQPRPFGRTYLAFYAQQAAQIALGLWLLLGAKGVARLIKRIRSR